MAMEENITARTALSKLNRQQAAFAQAYREGKTPMQAYCIAYNPKPTGRGKDYDQDQWAHRGHKILHNPKVQAYLDAFRMAIEKSSIKTAIETCEFLTEVIDSPFEKTKDKLRAVELLARIRGWFQDPPTVVLSPNAGDGGKAVINIIGVSNDNGQLQVAAKNG